MLWITECYTTEVLCLAIGKIIIIILKTGGIILPVTKIIQQKLTQLFWLCTSETLLWILTEITFAWFIHIGLKLLLSLGIRDIAGTQTVIMWQKWECVYSMSLLLHK